MLESIVEFTKNIVLNLGYFGVFIGIFLEAVFPPIPSEVILGISGMLVNDKKFNFLLVLITAIMANFCSGSLIWFLGRKLGKDFIIRYGKWVGVEKDEVDKGVELFHKHGYKVVFVSQMIPLIRTLIAFPSGIAKTVYWKFILANSLGATIWFTILLWAGTFFGQKYEEIDNFIKPFERVVIGAVLLVAIAWIIYKIKKNSQKNKAEESAEKTLLE